MGFGIIWWISGIRVMGFGIIWWVSGIRVMVLVLFGGFLARGFDFFGKPEDPKVHEALLRVQKSVLSHLLHPTTLQRLVDTHRYGGRYSAHEMLQTLSDGLFASDLAGNVNS